MPVIAGAVLSMLMGPTLALVELPAWSVTEAAADWLSPSPVMVESPVAAPSTPESASPAVKVTVTSALYQPLALAAVVGGAAQRRARSCRC